MIRTYLLLRPAPNSLEALVEYYRSQRVIEAAIPYGLLLGELAHPPHLAESIAVASLWSSTPDYDSWREAPERVRLITGMLPLLDGADAVAGWSGKAGSAAASAFAAVYGEQPVTVRLRAGQPAFLPAE